MPKLTLLEMTQDLLSSLDGDEVNSIGDTVEALQVATIIKQSYYNLTATLGLSSKMVLRTLDATNDLTKPNYLIIPNDVRTIEFIRYNDKDLIRLEPLEMLVRCSNQVNYIEVVDYGGTPLKIQTDQDPTHWTTFDDKHICFNSYNVADDTTLQSSKSVLWGGTDSVFELRDDFIPDLDVVHFPLLMAEAKATCFVDQKQTTNVRAEQAARQQLVRASNDKWRSGQLNPYNRLPDYSRRKR